MAKTPKKTRNRAAQDVTLINHRAVLKRLANLELAMDDVYEDLRQRRAAERRFVVGLRAVRAKHDKHHI